MILEYSLFPLCFKLDSGKHYTISFVRDLLQSRYCRLSRITSVNYFFRRWCEVLCQYCYFSTLLSHHNINIYAINILSSSDMIYNNALIKTDIFLFLIFPLNICFSAHSAKRAVGTMRLQDLEEELLKLQHWEPQEQLLLCLVPQGFIPNLGQFFLCCEWWI